MGMIGHKLEPYTTMIDTHSFGPPIPPNSAERATRTNTRDLEIYWIWVWVLPAYFSHIFRFTFPFTCRMRYVRIGFWKQIVLAWKTPTKLYFIVSFIPLLSSSHFFSLCFLDGTICGFPMYNYHRASLYWIYGPAKRIQYSYSPEEEEEVGTGIGSTWHPELRASQKKDAVEKSRARLNDAVYGGPRLAYTSGGLDLYFIIRWNISKQVGW